MKISVEIIIFLREPLRLLCGPQCNPLSYKGFRERCTRYCSGRLLWRSGISHRNFTKGNMTNGISPIWGIVNELRITNYI
jgi:hypothetical protein